MQIAGCNGTNHPDFLRFLPCLYSVYRCHAPVVPFCFCGSPTLLRRLRSFCFLVLFVPYGRPQPSTVTVDVTTPFFIFIARGFSTRISNCLQATKVGVKAVLADVLWASIASTYQRPHKPDVCGRREGAMHIHAAR